MKLSLPLPDDKRGAEQAASTQTVPAETVIHPPRGRSINLENLETFGTIHQEELATLSYLFSTWKHLPSLLARSMALFFWCRHHPPALGKAIQDRKLMLDVGSHIPDAFSLLSFLHNLFFHCIHCCRPTELPDVAKSTLLTSSISGTAVPCPTSSQIGTTTRGSYPYGSTPAPSAHANSLVNHNAASAAFQTSPDLMDGFPQLGTALGVNF